MLARDSTSLARLAQKTPNHAAPKELSNDTPLELCGTGAVPLAFSEPSGNKLVSSLITCLRFGLLPVFYADD
jgi:hypothetical protein